MLYLPKRQDGQRHLSPMEESRPSHQPYREILSMTWCRCSKIP
nr:unnamed protein product [Callosobruchus chinensis]